jgi:hypothetical protein
MNAIIVFSKKNYLFNNDLVKNLNPILQKDKSFSTVARVKNLIHILNNKIFLTNN